MTKTVLATIAIWLAGVGSAAALVTTLARPPQPAAHDEMVQPEPAQPEPTPNIEHFKVPKPLAELAPKIRAEIKVPFKVRKHREMRCSEPRPLQIGPIDRSVRYCQ